LAVVKRLFLLVGPSGSGKSTLTKACRSDPSLKIFGDSSEAVRWHTGYSVENGGHQIVFRENVAPDAPSISIKGFVLFPEAELVDPPDGLLVHVDLFTLAGVDEARFGRQSEEEIRRNYQRGLQPLLKVFDQVVVTTLRIPRKELAGRILERLRRRNLSRRIKSRKRRWRVALALAVRDIVPAAWADRIFGLVLGGNRDRIYFGNDGSWLEKLTRVWNETAAQIGGENYFVETDNGRVIVVREK
jgi:hypothetical protein